MADLPSITGPDLERDGIPLDALAESTPFLGHIGDDAVMLVKRGDDVFATGATCTHYSGPLAEGVVRGDTIRCPWHHACFSLRTGAAIAAPALNPIPVYRVVIREGVVYALPQPKTIMIV